MCAQSVQLQAYKVVSTDVTVCTWLEEWKADKEAGRPAVKLEPRREPAQPSRPGAAELLECVAACVIMCQHHKHSVAIFSFHSVRMLGPDAAARPPAARRAGGLTPRPGPPAGAEAKKARRHER